jgi:hypothetical protein
VHGMIAVLNAGSSSLKSALHDPATTGTASLRGQIQGIGSKPSLAVRNAAGDIVREQSRSAEAIPCDREFFCPAPVFVGFLYAGQRLGGPSTPFSRSGEQGSQRTRTATLQRRAGKSRSASPRLFSFSVNESTVCNAIAAIFAAPKSAAAFMTGAGGRVPAPSLLPAGAGAARPGCSGRRERSRRDPRRPRRLRCARPGTAR